MKLLMVNKNLPTPVASYVDPMYAYSWLTRTQMKDTLIAVVYEDGRHHVLAFNDNIPLDSFQRQIDSIFRIKRGNAWPGEEKE